MPAGDRRGPLTPLTRAHVSGAGEAAGPAPSTGRLPEAIRQARGGPSAGRTSLIGSRASRHSRVYTRA